MDWPQVLDYNEAVQTPGYCFADAELRQGEVASNAAGWPMPCTGNFAAVYRVTCPGQRVWAVKCFTREIPDRKDRYRAISEHLRRVRKHTALPFLIECDFQEEGVRVHGQWYPVLKMNWVEGQTLNEFVERAVEKPNVLAKLSALWVRLAQELRGAKIAHGDLQHGNVLLIQGGKSGAVRLTLVDYDGMYVPALASRRSSELGHPNFQHPRRQQQPIFNGELDRFSHLVIVTALHCLAVKPGLWEDFNNGENLLFREEDFSTPATSSLFQQLWQLPAGSARTLAGHLVLATELPLDRVPLLHEIIRDNETLALTPEQEQHVERLLASGRGRLRVAPKRSPLLAARPKDPEPSGPAPWWAATADAPTAVGEEVDELAPLPLVPLAEPEAAPAAPAQPAMPQEPQPPPEFQPEADAAALAAAHLAKRLSAHLQESAPKSFYDYLSVLQAEKQLRQKFPRVDPAYEPSGRIDPEGHRLLLLGASVAALLGFAVALTGLTAIGGLLYVLGADRHPNAVPILCLRYLAALALLAAAWLLGAVAGRLTAETGKAGNNRSIAWATWYAGLAVTVAVLAAYSVYRVSPFQATIIEPEGLTLVIVIVLGFVAAGIRAAKVIAAARYCEDCHCYHVERGMPGVCLGGLTVLVAAVRLGNLEAAVGALKCAGADDTGVARFSLCPSCNAGFLDVEVHAIGKWRTSRKQTRVRRRSWLAASRRLTGDQMRFFAGHRLFRI